jgi:hypothetical protein
METYAASDVELERNDRRFKAEVDARFLEEFSEVGHLADGWADANAKAKVRAAARAAEAAARGTNERVVHNPTSTPEERVAASSALEAAERERRRLEAIPISVPKTFDVAPLRRTLEQLQRVTVPAIPEVLRRYHHEVQRSHGVNRPAPTLAEVAADPVADVEIVALWRAYKTEARSWANTARGLNARIIWPADGPDAVDLIIQAQRVITWGRRLAARAAALSDAVAQSNARQVEAGILPVDNVWVPKAGPSVKMGDVRALELLVA